VRLIEIIRMKAEAMSARLRIIQRGKPRSSAFGFSPGSDLHREIFHARGLTPVEKSFLQARLGDRFAIRTPDKPAAAPTIVRRAPFQPFRTQIFLNRGQTSTEKCSKSEV
jgi:hypothetical protein